jgi:hypothetical protein
MRNRLVVPYCLGLLLLLALARTSAAEPPVGQAIVSTTRPGVVPRPQSHVTEAAIAAGLAAFLVLTNIVCFIVIVALNFRHALSFDFADAWEDPQYLRALPNALAALKQRRFKSPWPGRCNPWSMHRFERCLLGALRPHLKDRAGAFVERHMSVWIWVESHRAECRHLLHARQVERVLECLAATDSPDKRAELLAFLNAPRASEKPASPDRQTMQRLLAMERIQIIMREHGYSVSTEFSQKDELEHSPDEKLLDLLCCRDETKIGDSAPAVT